MSASQTQADLTHLRDRLARLEMLFDTLSKQHGAVAQAVQLNYGNNGDGGGTAVVTFRLSVSSSAATGKAYTTDGRGVIQYDNSGTFADVSGATATELRNKHLKGITAGTNVLVDCYLSGGSWWIFDLNDCAKYI